MDFDLQSAAIILINKGKVLMQLRDDKPNIDFPNHWCLPGGKVEPDEEERKGAQRELLEETGYISKNPIFLHSEIYTTKGGRRIKRNIFYEIYDGKQEIKCLEGQKMEFKSPDELSLLKVYSDHFDLIKRAIGIVNQK